MSSGVTRVPWSVRAAFVGVAAIVRPLRFLLVDRRYEGFEHIPRGQGCIVCCNHVTEIDPVVVGHALYVHGEYPHFLAKDGLFRNPVAGAVMRSIGQIPVERRGSSSAKSLEAARHVLDYGGVIVIYPEGTLTRDPQLWPMKARTGAARLALETRVPVIPMAQWGAHELVKPYGRRLHLFPRKTFRVRAGAPLDLSEFYGRPIDREVLDAVAERIQAATTAILAELRGEVAPVTRFDPLTAASPALSAPHAPPPR
jgi:1-acyl-sn-glycerol-3-phosphate acyltransferase